MYQNRSCIEAVYPGQTFKYLDAVYYITKIMQKTLCCMLISLLNIYEQQAQLSILQTHGFGFETIYF